MERPEIFPAHMDAFVNADLAFEQHPHQAQIDQELLSAKREPRVQVPEESSDDESPASSDHPVEDPPVYFHPAGPNAKPIPLLYFSVPGSWHQFIPLPSFCLALRCFSWSFSGLLLHGLHGLLR
jgi:hypothetical protein